MVIMKRFVAAILVLCVLLCGCSDKTKQTEPATRQFFAMDTVMGVTVYGDDGEKILDEVYNEITRLESTLSRTEKSSIISKINANAGLGAVAVTDEIFELLSFCREISEEFPNCYDVTIAPVMDLWGFTKDEKHVPESEMLSSAMELVDFSAVEEKDNTVFLKNHGMELDLGSVAKGYSAQRSIEIIKNAGCTSALLDLGHNISAVGTKPDGSAWNVAVKDPINTDGYIGIIAMSDVTASTSGGYERYFVEDGHTYHHIIDPKTGYPADAGLISVTVVSDDPVLADALSTAIYVSGAEKGLEYWLTVGGFELVLCTSDKNVIVTEGLSFTPTGEEMGYTYETVSH